MRKRVVVAVLIVIASLVLNAMLLTKNTGLEKQIGDINATFANLSSNACAIGCNMMLNLLHTNDTNVNTQLLASCWGNCGININS